MSVSREIIPKLRASTPASSPHPQVEPWVLLALAAALLLTNRWFTVLDDEANAIVVATAPARYLISTFLAQAYPHAHPPLPDLLLHFWLRLSGSRMLLLRLPAVACYVAGIALVTKTAEALAGRSARMLALWIAVLWPYGFHFGRLAGWFAVSFLTVSWLTLAFVQGLQRQHAADWWWFGIAALIAIYSNFYAWAMLALLLVEVIIRRERRVWRPFLLLLAMLAAAYAPAWVSLIDKTRVNYAAGHRVVQLSLLSLYHLYVALVSESVAPWAWPLSVPAMLAMMVAAAILLARSRGFGRRLLLYFAILVAGMSLANVISTKRILMLTPWLLLGMALAVREVMGRRLRITVLACLGVIAATGWIGIATRRFYAAPHFIEPWATVAANASSAWRSGAVVISNSGPFFFYFAYAAGRPWTAANWEPAALLRQPPLPRVASPAFWRAGDAPVANRVLLVKGVDPFEPAADAWAEENLERRCSLQSVQRKVRDSGSAWKQRFFPQAGQIPWRIEVRQYRCGVSPN